MPNRRILDTSDRPDFNSHIDLLTDLLVAKHTELKTILPECCSERHKTFRGSDDEAATLQRLERIMMHRIRKAVLHAIIREIEYFQLYSIEGVVLLPEIKNYKAA